MQIDCFPECLRVTVVCMFRKVIEEIEEMMQESPDPEDDETPTQSDRLSLLSQEIQTLQRSSTSSYEESKTPSLNPCSSYFPCISISGQLGPSQAVTHTLQPSSNARAYFSHCLGLVIFTSESHTSRLGLL